MLGSSRLPKLIGSELFLRAGLCKPAGKQPILFLLNPRRCGRYHRLIEQGTDILQFSSLS